MAQTEFDNCRKCGIGKMKPLSRVMEDRDPNTNRPTGGYREYKCDNCGNPEGGAVNVSQANEQEDLSESASIKSAASGNSYDPTAS
jgi:hypothetical protein